MENTELPGLKETRGSSFPLDGAMSLNPSARHPVYKNKYNPTPSETTPHNSSPRAPIKKKKKKNLNMGQLTLRGSKSNAITLTGCNQELHGGAPLIGHPPGYTCSPDPALSLGRATARATRGAFAARSPPGPPVRLGTPGPPGVLTP